MTSQADLYSDLEDYEIQVMLEDLARQEREAAEANLKPFVRQAWSWLGEPNEYLDNWHIELICEYLELVTLGDLTRLIINIPTRYMKSLLVSVDWPCWDWLRTPKKRWMFSSYSHELSVKHSLKRRRILESVWYQKNWSHIIEMDPRHNQQDDFGNTAGGEMLATSMSGSATGLGGNCLYSDTLITTDIGLICVEDLVRLHEAPRVLAFNHSSRRAEWRQIQGWRVIKNGSPMLEIESSTGHKVRVTAEHHIFTCNRGYQEAHNLRPGDRIITHTVKEEQNLSVVRESEKIRHKIANMPRLLRQAAGCQSNTKMHVLRRNIREAAIRLHEGYKARVQGLLLHSELLRATSRHKECEEMRVLRSSDARKTAQQILLRGLSYSEQIFKKANRCLSTMRQRLLSKVTQNAILLQRMRRPGTFGTYEGKREPPFSRWLKLCKVVQRNEASDTGARFPQMPEMRQRRNNISNNLERVNNRPLKSGHPSLERAGRRQQARELSNDVQNLSCGVPSLEEETILEIRAFNPGECEVYDIQVEGCNNFFADQILVHNCLVIDDPVDPTQARSKVQRDAANREFDQKFYNRLDDKKKGAIVVVMQRVNEEDLTGHVTGLKDADLNSYLIKSGEWLVLRIPAEAEQTEEIRFPLHPEYNFERKKGDLLWPKREGPQQIANARRVMDWGYSGQYQQRPAAETGNIIQRHWIKYYIKRPLKFDFWLQSWDMSFKDLDTSSYVCGGVLALKGADVYLIDWIMEKMDLPTTIEAVKRMSKDYPRCKLKLVEDAANGPAVIQSLKRKIPGMVAVPASGSKESRLYATQPMFEAENVWFPDPSIRPDIKERVNELCTFPAATVKDFVDMLAHGLNRYNQMQIRKQAHARTEAVSYGDDALADANSWYS